MITQKAFCKSRSLNLKLSDVSPFFEVATSNFHYNRDYILDKLFTILS